MTRSFLPRAGQVREVLTEAGVSDHPKYGRSRGGIVAEAKKFVDTVPYDRDGETKYANRAFHPEKGSGVQYITGASRIVLDLLYSLFVAAPVASKPEAIEWALNEAPLYAVREFDLGEDRKTGGRRVGLIGQAAYTAALVYFEASMQSTLDDRQQAAALASESNRADKFRAVTSQTIGSLLSDEQKQALRKGRPGSR